MYFHSESVVVTQAEDNPSTLTSKDNNKEASPLSAPKASYATHQTGMSFNAHASKEKISGGNNDGDSHSYMSNFKTLLESSPKKGTTFPKSTTTDSKNTFFFFKDVM